ncbi:hypothetical protein TNCV_479001 [Trichonephila clavipes]|nr:hypothetical protein TNCV_479001 [Trichonephila clavipes]
MDTGGTGLICLYLNAKQYPSNRRRAARPIGKGTLVLSRPEEHFKLRSPTTLHGMPPPPMKSSYPIGRGHCSPNKLKSRPFSGSQQAGCRVLPAA